MHRDEPIEYAAIPLTSYASDTILPYDSISEVLENYYAQRSLYTRMRQKSRSASCDQYTIRTKTAKNMICRKAVKRH